MNDKHDIQIEEATNLCIKNARFRAGVAVKTKIDNVYRFGIIDEPIMAADGEIAYRIVTHIGGVKTYVYAKERFISPASILDVNVLDLPISSPSVPF